ncbi:MAG: 1,4-alpha-glucan branching protein GlgB [Acidobacteria bacterium]|nr:1,4-alpha-glucan branching protein GlgB [Acidobacteriota bacterium]
MLVTTPREQLQFLIAGEERHPFALLGPHVLQDNNRRTVFVRAFLPDATHVEVLSAGAATGEPTIRIHEAGIFEAILAELPRQPYRFRFRNRQGGLQEQYDPYFFRELLSEFDLHLLMEGTHLRAFEKMGAHPVERQGITGTLFAVWAPNARSISVIGDFNNWDGRGYGMELHEASGVWQLFVPHLTAGALYKYQVRLRDGGIEEKIDPYANYSEQPPRTASIVYRSRYKWNDQEWMQTRETRNALDAPLSFYEVHVGSWKRKLEEGECFLNYRELAELLVPYVKDMGYTHLELLPISEHPLSASWGYQTTGYYAPTSRFGNPDDFRYFVDTCHQAGIGLILDWVPGHFPRDLHALAHFDGTHLYEHADPRLGSHPDWGTLIFNYGRNEVANFLIANALFWLDEFHIDGLRVDAVASMLYLDYSRKPGEWIPNRYGGNENLEAIQFLKRFNETVHQRFPGVLTIGEESTAWPGVSRPTYIGGLGFSLKWNMGWMHDSLVYMSKDPVHRRYHHNNLTFSLLYAFSENFVLPLSHDEVVHGKGALLNKMPGDLWQRFANLRAYYGYMYGHPGKKLLFMGGEFGQWNEWNFDASLDWHLLQWESHVQLQRFVRDLNHIYRSEPALHQVDFDWAGFEWIDFHDADSGVIAFLRRARDPDDFVVVVCNFTPVPRLGYRIGVPREGLYRELLNSDSAFYGGSNLGNSGGVPSEPRPFQAFPHSLKLTLPPLSTLFLKP